MFGWLPIHFCFAVFEGFLFLSCSFWFLLSETEQITYNKSVLFYFIFLFFGGARFEVYELLFNLYCQYLFISFTYITRTSQCSHSITRFWYCSYFLFIYYYFLACIVQITKHEWNCNIWVFHTQFLKSANIQSSKSLSHRILINQAKEIWRVRKKNKNNIYIFNFIKPWVINMMKREKVLTECLSFFPQWCTI